MMNKIALKMMVVLFSLMGLAPYGFADVCSTAKDDLIFSLKLMSYIDHKGFTDNSAPRETNRQLQIGNELLRVQLNYSLLKDNKCPLSDISFTKSQYVLEATECALDELKQISSAIKNEAHSSESPESCNFSLWKGRSGATEELPIP